MKLGYILLFVSNIEESVKFYEQAFGLTRKFIHESNQYAEMLTGETTLGFVAHSLAKEHKHAYEETSLKKAPPSFELGFVTQNVELSYQNAIDAAAIPVSEPAQKPWGQTVAYVRDLNGYLVEICSPLQPE